VSTEPGADERRMTYLLRRQIDGPTAGRTGPAPAQRLIPPRPSYAPDVPDAPADWVDELLTRTRAGAAGISPGPATDEGARTEGPDGDDGQEPEGQDADTAAPVPVQPPAPGTAAGPPARDASRWRFLAFNGAAAAAGYYGGLVGTFSPYLPAAQASAVGMFATALALAAGWTAWRITGLDAVSHILPGPTSSRLILTVGAAEFGRRLAPLPVTWLSSHSTHAGFSPADIALLLTVCGLCGGLWWLIDRHTRAWWWGIRLLLRIPLASALLATALHAPGVTS
jgi:hypothetical protein